MLTNCMKRNEELFSSNSLRNVFHLICDHEYEIKMPKDVSITHQVIDHIALKFKIPALCFWDTPKQSRTPLVISQRRFIFLQINICSVKQKNPHLV